MLSPLKKYFQDKVNGKEFLSLFEKMAYTITNEYINSIYNEIEHSGFPPPMKRTLHDIEMLTTELTMKAEWMRDNYKEGKGYRSIKLTTGCKRIIKHSVNRYLTQVNTVNTINESKLFSKYNSFSNANTQLEVSL